MSDRSLDLDEITTYEALEGAYDELVDRLRSSLTLRHRDADRVPLADRVITAEPRPGHVALVLEADEPGTFHVLPNERGQPSQVWHPTRYRAGEVLRMVLHGPVHSFASRAVVRDWREARGLDSAATGIPKELWSQWQAEGGRERVAAETERLFALLHPEWSEIPERD